jgi:hypothetical protein
MGPEGVLITARAVAPGRGRAGSSLPLRGIPVADVVVMNGARPIITVFLAAIALVAWGMWSEEGHLSSSPYALEELNPTVSDYADALPEVRRQEFIVDRYGNRIEEAVGDYRVDPRGDIFERHSPATAVPRLPDPSA